jgi:hypothetical protein
LQIEARKSGKLKPVCHIYKIADSTMPDHKSEFLLAFEQEEIASDADYSGT